MEVYYLADCAQDGSPPGMRTGRSFGISDISLFQGAFSHLRLKTGIVITECDDVRLYPAHQRLLTDYLTSTGASGPELKAFMNFLSQSIRENAVLIFVGD